MTTIGIPDNRRPHRAVGAPGPRPPRSSPHLFLLSVLFLVVVGAADGQTSLGGTLSLMNTIYPAGGGALVTDDTDGESGYDWSLRLEPLLTADTDRFSLTARLSIKQEQARAAEFSLSSLAMELFLGPSITAKAGKFLYQPGNSEYLSPHDYLVRTDFEKLFGGESLDAQLGTELLQLTAFLRSAYLRLSYAPLKPELLLPQPDSIWFPRRDIPARYSNFELRRLYYTAEPQRAPRLSDGSYLAEFGTTLAGFDLSLLGYYGWSTEALLYPSLGALDLAGFFDVELTPIQERYGSVGSSVATSFGGMRLYGEGSYAFERPYPKSDSFGVVTNDESPYGTVGALETTVGGSYNGYLNSVLGGDLFWLALAEHHRVWLLPDSVEPPFLSHAVSTRTEAGHSSGVSVAVDHVLSLEEGTGWSGALIPELRFEDTISSLAGYLRYPLFWGSRDSELGQFRGNYLLLLGLELLF